MDRMGIIVMSVLAAIGLVSLPFIWRQRRRDHERMRAVADELGFTYHGKVGGGPGGKETGFVVRFLAVLQSWHVTGSRDGVAVAIYPVHRTEGRIMRTYTIVEASLPQPLPFCMEVSRESGLTKVGKILVGTTDVEIGDAEFDREVRIDAADRDAVRRLLADARIRGSILSALRACPGITVTDRAATFEAQVSSLDAERCRRVMDLVVPIVAALRDSGAFEAQPPS